MKQFFFLLIILLTNTGYQSALPGGQKNILHIPILLQKGNLRGQTITNLCGVTCAEMVLRYYGITNISNVDMAEKFCSDLYPAYNIKMNYSDSDKELYTTNCEKSLSTGTDFPGTNMHVLQIFFTSLGLNTDRQRTSYDKKTGQIPDGRFTMLMSHVRNAHPVIIHVEKHYMVLIGFDDSKRLLYVIDPSDTALLTVSYKSFINHNNRWRRTKPERRGWDGRYLAVWK